MLTLADFVTLQPQQTASFRQVIARLHNPRYQLKPGKHFVQAEINKINRIDEHLSGYDEFCKKHGLKPWVSGIESGAAPVMIAAEDPPAAQPAESKQANERTWSDATIDFTLRVTAGNAKTPCVAEIVITNKTDSTQSVPWPYVMPLCGEGNKNNIRVSGKDGNPLEMRGLHWDGSSRGSTELAAGASKTWRFELERNFADMADPGTYQVEPWYFSDHTKWSSG